MKSVALFCVTVLIGMTTNLSAQSHLEIPYIEVTGTAKLEVVPDEFYVNITLRERYDGRDKITIDKQEEDLRRAFIAIGIPDTQFYLADVDADYMKVRWNTKDVITQKNYTLKVTTPTLLSKAFQAMDEKEIKDAYLSRVDHSQMDSLRREVRMEAVRAAKDKATYLLAAIDTDLGAPLIVREQEMYYGNRNMEMYNVRMDDMDKASEPLPELQFQKIQLEQSVFVRFAIAAAQ
ncbi:MAG TPA: hypothetical protein DCG22_06575 [Bacteroidetes bacterium]|nr:hypothetical protein [Bacteroidota bacterium]